MEMTQRIKDGRDLGRARRGVDIGLAAASIAPIVGLAGLQALLPAEQRVLAEEAAVIWTGCLLCFLGGVRRGLTFSEAGNGRLSELATMLGVFVLGVLTIGLNSPWIGAAGCVSVGALDVIATRRLQTPRYFARLRPVQMGAAALALASIGAFTPSGV